MRAVAEDMKIRRTERRNEIGTGECLYHSHLTDCHSEVPGRGPTAHGNLRKLLRRARGNTTLSVAIRQHEGFVSRPVPDIDFLPKLRRSSFLRFPCAVGPRPGTSE
jgi:hypothetical protein